MRPMLFVVVTTGSLVLAAIGCRSAPEREGDAAPSETTAASSASVPSDLPSHVALEGMLSPPFSAEQLRQAHPVGLVRVFEIRAADGSTGRRRSEVVESSATAVTFEDILIDSGDPPKRSTATWEELVGHAAHYPTEYSTVRNAKRTSELGTFDCWVYAMTSPDGAASEFWFARSQPGPPILYTQRRGDIVDFEMELVELHRP
ncbi:MAG: hypothetical protein KDC38_04595 [Planctomycetes bacterium]|nr:hypothetical protein [Planctomycetota bacterium]